MLVIVPLLIAVWNMHSQADLILKLSIQEQLLSAARVLAHSVDAEAHQQLKESAQENSAEYARLVRQMGEARNAIDPVRMIKFTYTCMLDGQQVRFVLDTTPSGDADHDGRDDKAHLMELYEQPSPTLRRVLEIGLPMVDEKPYSDRWGTFMSAFAPIFDADHKLVGATGVDMSLEDFELQRSGLRHVASLSALGVLFLAYLAGHGMAGYHRRLKSSVQSLMKANAAAMSAQRVKNDFLGAMSHELRTPLNAVLGMSEMLSQTPLEPSQREMVTTVQRSGESLLATLTSILEFTQLDPDRSQVKAEETSLAALLREIHKHHEPALREKRLQVVHKIADGCPGFFTAQTVFLRQVLSQLLSNAIKFTDAGGIEIRVRATRQEDGGGLLHFEVQDTGIGIAGHDAERLFEPLFQVDGSTTRRHGGTGMGLALSKRLCDAMKARIWAESKPGHGSTFHVEVPVEAFRTEIIASGPLALVWTDDSMTRMLVSRVIEKAGSKVETVSAFDELKNHPKLDQAAVCVVDAHEAPAEIVTQIRDLVPRARLIVIHGHTDPNSHPAADVIVPAPVKPAELRKALDASS
jgi:signal transduction histidine kinase